MKASAQVNETRELDNLIMRCRKTSLQQSILAVFSKKNHSVSLILERDIECAKWKKL